MHPRSDQKRNEDEWVYLGQVGRPHGLQGAFFVAQRSLPWAPEFQHVSIGKRPGKNSRQYKVRSHDFRNGRVILCCEGLANREQLSTVQGLAIWFPRDKVHVDHSSEFLWQDLLGVAVEDKDQVQLGVVKDIYNAGASDVITVENEKGLFIDLPLVSSYFDLSFTDVPSKLTLTLEKSLLAELWYEMAPGKERKD